MSPFQIGPLQSFLSYFTYFLMLFLNLDHFLDFIDQFFCPLAFAPPISMQM